MASEEARRAELTRFASDLTMLVHRAANTVDPVGLIRDGAPEDEYDHEVDRIVARLVHMGRKPLPQKQTR